jgi:hypothetical protein
MINLLPGMHNGPERNEISKTAIFNFLHHILTSENTLVLDIFTDLKNSNEWISSLGLRMSFIFNDFSNIT